MGFALGVCASILVRDRRLEVERQFWRELTNNLTNRVQSWSPEQYAATQANEALLAARAPESAENSSLGPNTLEEAVAIHPDFMNKDVEWAEDGQSATIIDGQTLRGEVVDRQRLRHIVGWWQD